MKAFFKISCDWHTFSAKFQLLSNDSTHSWQILCGINSSGDSSREQHLVSFSTRRKFGSAMDVSWSSIFNDAHNRQISVMALKSSARFNFLYQIDVRKRKHQQIFFLSSLCNYMDYINNTHNISLTFSLRLQWSWIQFPIGDSQYRWKCLPFRYKNTNRGNTKYHQTTTSISTTFKIMENM